MSLPLVDSGAFLGGAGALAFALSKLVPALVGLRGGANGNGKADQTQMMRHLEKQGDALNSIAQDIHLSVERQQEFMLENREYQREGREAMLRISAMYQRQLGG